MTRHLQLALLLAAAALGASLAAGAHRRGALVGSITSSASGIVSLLFMQRGARARKPMQAALAVMALMFLVRILLVALGTVLVARSGESVVAFVVAFFVPYFTFAAIEAAYLTGLSRGPGSTA